jgi:hypothetical protein
MKRALAWSRAAFLACAVSGAAAHDTWFQPLALTPAGQMVFALSTGTRFPSFEFPLGYEYLAGSGCRGEGATAAPLVHVEDRPVSLVVRSATPLKPRAGLTCWAQLTAFDVEVPPDKIELYLREIQAGPALRATWAAMKARGLPWRERYLKSARIELGGSGLREALPGLTMDVRLDNPRAPIRAGDELTFQVLRDGAPIAELPVELVNHLNPLGLWRKTDSEGRVRLAPPLAGRWLLRGVDLRVARKTPDEWESWFVTLAFDVGPRETR